MKGNGPYTIIASILVLLALSTGAWLMISVSGSIGRGFFAKSNNLDSHASNDQSELAVVGSDTNAAPSDSSASQSVTPPPPTSAETEEPRNSSQEHSVPETASEQPVRQIQQPIALQDIPEAQAAISTSFRTGKPQRWIGQGFKGYANPSAAEPSTGCRNIGLSVYEGGPNWTADTQKVCS